MAGERRVIFQQLQNRAVFPALVGQQIQRNIFRQIAHELAALVGKRIERLFGHINLREAGRQRAYDGVGRYRNGHHHSRSKGAVTSCAESAAGEHALELHSFHLRFSSACTARNRNTPHSER